VAKEKKSRSRCKGFELKARVRMPIRESRCPISRKPYRESVDFLKKRIQILHTRQEAVDLIFYSAVNGENVVASRM
jgi:hypothetical protein